MTYRDKSPLLEASESLREYRESSEKKRQKKLAEAATEKAKLEEQIYFGAKAKREEKYKAYSEFCNNTKHELLADVIKGIYIGAISENLALTENGIGLAESLVDNLIKESGGATSMLSKFSGKTYVLDTIKAIVEGTYESIIEDADPEDEETQEVPDEKKSEMYDDLNKEEEINNAVKVIAKRVTDAEEEFIKKNSEDKKTLEDIATKFNERIKKVEDATEDEADQAETDEEEEEIKDEGEETVKQESRIARRMSGDVRENRTRNVYEQVVRNLTSTILKDESLREEYIDEDGKLDMGSVVEAATCIYGLLETVNTLQIANVNAEYVQEALATM